MRFVDIVFIQKEEDGSTRTVELNDLDPESYAMFVPMGEHVSSLFTNDDLEIAASKLPNNSAAMLILWENLWVVKAVVLVTLYTRRVREEPFGPNHGRNQRGQTVLDLPLEYALSIRLPPRYRLP